jgi:hypothetical protein
VCYYKRVERNNNNTTEINMNARQMNRKLKIHITRRVMQRAIDALVDLIEVIHNRGEQDNWNTREIENLINNLKGIVEIIE